MKRPLTVEPGLLRIFRWYVGIRLGLLALAALANRGERPPQPGQFPATGIVLFGLLFVLLVWRGGERRRWYLPLAIALATIAPIADATANVAGRLDAGLTPNETLVDYWLPFFLLFVPFIITAWQYRYRWVVVFAILSTIVEMLTLTAVFGEGEAQLAVLGALLAARGVLFAFLGFFITKLVARQRDLRADLERRAVMSEQLATGRERARLARELHDTLAHAMTATAVQLEAAQALWSENPDRALGHVELALDGTRAGLAEARRAIQDLRASPLEERGLVGALEWLAGETEARSGLSVKLVVEGDTADLDHDLEQVIFRVAEEAIANAARHSSADAVRVHLEAAADRLSLNVADDGVGFEPDLERAGHHGLKGMLERAALVGGSVAVDSTPGHGAAIELTVPRQLQ